MVRGVGSVDMGAVLQKVVVYFQRLHQGRRRLTVSYVIAVKCVPWAKSDVYDFLVISLLSSS